MLSRYCMKESSESLELLYSAFFFGGELEDPVLSSLVLDVGLPLFLSEKVFDRRRG